MKKKNIIFSLLLASSVILTNVQPILASNATQKEFVIEYLNENSPLLKGKNPPSGSSFVDLSITDYSYSVDSFKYKVFTNSQFSGVSEINVYVGNIYINKNNSPHTSKGVTVRLYSGKKEIDSKYVGVSGVETVNFTGLDKSKKYHIAFTKNDDYQIYEFAGTISGN